jgi:hypothetical protein
MTDNEVLRDMAAMFALTLMGGKFGAGCQLPDIADECYAIADAMMSARNKNDNAGLPAIKRTNHANKTNRTR